MHNASLRPLIYFQDIGGTRFLLPVINSLTKLLKKFESIVMFHEKSSMFSSALSESLNNHFSYTSIKNFSIMEWKSILTEENIGLVVCTMSSKYIDMTNCNLIAACNELDIQSIGFFDHWKGFDRLKDTDNRFTYMTSIVGVIDNYVKDGLINEGVSPDRVKVVGHPLLETISPKNYNNDPCEAIVISQPNIMDKSFNGIFNLPLFENKSFIDRLAAIFSSEFTNLKLLYKSHPKENKATIIKADLFKESWEETNKSKKIFLGFDSMLLFESYLFNHEVIILNFPEFKQYSDKSIPYDFGHSVKDFNDLEERLFAIVSGEYKNKSNTFLYREVISHSIDRSKNLIENTLLKY
jgi:hypothetical protein